MSMPSIGPTVRAAAERAAAENEISIEEVFEKTKRPECVRARRMVMFELRDAGWSLSRIGRVFDYDHTTILYHTRGEKPGA